MSNETHKSLVAALNGKTDDIGAAIAAWRESRFSNSEALRYISEGVLLPEAVEESASVGGDGTPAPEPSAEAPADAVTLEENGIVEATPVHTASEDSLPDSPQNPVAPYDEWTSAELSAELEARELAHSGTKAEKIARLEENDLEDEAKA